MTMKRQILCSCLLVLLFCSGAPSDDKPADKADKNAGVAEKVLASLAKAYNAREAKSISELFTPTGEFIDGEGNVFQGREKIAGEFTALFEKNPKSSVELSAEDVREISPGVLSVDSVASVAGAEEPDDATIELEVLLVKQSDGSWLLASLRSEGDEDELTPHVRLKQLEWLIGEWVDESDESTMHTTTRWSDDGNFILSEFTIHVAGRKVMSGTQRIGWDGSLEKFKSWVFDSEGGHGEGIWTELDDRWVVKSTGVRPDGDAGSATHTYQQLGDDAYLFAVTDRIVGDDTEPDFTAHIVRKPPAPDAAANAAAPRGK